VGGGGQGWDGRGERKRLGVGLDGCGVGGSGMVVAVVGIIGEDILPSGYTPIQVRLIPLVVYLYIILYKYTTKGFDLTSTSKCEAD
jgi:hypothetical protein